MRQRSEKEIWREKEKNIQKNTTQFGNKKNDTKKVKQKQKIYFDLKGQTKILIKKDPEISANRNESRVKCRSSYWTHDYFPFCFHLQIKINFKRSIRSEWNSSQENHKKMMCKDIKHKRKKEENFESFIYI